MFIQEPIEDFPLCSSKPNQCNFALKHPTADVVCPIGHRGYFLVVAHMPPTEGAHMPPTEGALHSHTDVPQRLQKPIYQKTIVQVVFHKVLQ